MGIRRPHALNWAQCTWQLTKGLWIDIILKEFTTMFFLLQMSMEQKNPKAFSSCCENVWIAVYGAKQMLCSQWESLFFFLCCRWGPYTAASRTLAFNRKQSEWSDSHWTHCIWPPPFFSPMGMLMGNSLVYTRAVRNPPLHVFTAWKY